MQVVTPKLVKGKRIILRLDIDVPLKQGAKIADDFRLKRGLQTVELCLNHAESVVVIGHLGRPKGQDETLSVKPIVDWLADHVKTPYEDDQFIVLENLRFQAGESFDDAQDENEVLRFAKELAEYGNFYVNEAFAAHHRAASTTTLPTLLPHAAGLNFFKEVEVLTKLKDKPLHPNLAIIGGAKVEDKYPAVVTLSKLFDTVLVGGLVGKAISDKQLAVSENVKMGKLSDSGIDMDEETIDSWRRLISQSKQVLWAGPIGKYEDPEGNQGNKLLAEAIIHSGVESIIGGGDTQAALSSYIDQFTFVSAGGGAMLEFFENGTLPTIEALK